MDHSRTMRWICAPAAAGAVIALCALAGCATGERATPMDTTQQDFEQLWAYDKPAESEARFRAELARHAPGTDAHGQLLTQIARTHSLRRNFDLAHRLLDQAEAALPAAGPRVRVRVELERGRAVK